jgi:hypothetical protein
MPCLSFPTKKMLIDIRELWGILLVIKTGSKAQTFESRKTSLRKYLVHWHLPVPENVAAELPPELYFPFYHEITIRNPTASITWTDAPAKEALSFFQDRSPPKQFNNWTLQMESFPRLHLSSYTDTNSAETNKNTNISSLNFLFSFETLYSRYQANFMFTVPFDISIRIFTVTQKIITMSQIWM